MKLMIRGQTGLHLFLETAAYAELSGAEGQGTIRDKQDWLAREKEYGRNDERTVPRRFV
jgi:hypothetical protein